jgi:hypothetical protein
VIIVEILALIVSVMAASVVFATTLEKEITKLCAWRMCLSWGVR